VTDAENTEIIPFIISAGVLVLGVALNYFAGAAYGNRAHINSVSVGKRKEINEHVEKHREWNCYKFYKGFAAGAVYSLPTLLLILLTSLTTGNVFYETGSAGLTLYFSSLSLYVFFANIVKNASIFYIVITLALSIIATGTGYIIEKRKLIRRGKK